MIESKPEMDKKKLDPKEFELPETVFIRDIENKVFQSIVLQCLSQVEGISLVEGNFIDHLLGRNSERIKGVYAEQDEKSHSINIKVEVDLYYGIPVPEKAEEIQTRIVEEITTLTGLHVSSVHVVVKNMISREQAKNTQGSSSHAHSNLEEEYSNGF